MLFNCCKVKVLTYGMLLATHDCYVHFDHLFRCLISHLYRIRINNNDHFWVLSPAYL